MQYYDRTAMKITIDHDSGFCFGVKRAIEQAEAILEETGRLHCIGDIVHNIAEMERLKKKGLISVDHNRLNELSGEPVLFRAHGEPPSSYIISGRNKNELTDATCPIVKKLQVRIKKAWEALSETGGQLVIFGDPDHPETIGLQGQTGEKAIIISDPDNLKGINPRKPVEVFSQTTKSTEGFMQLEKNIGNFMKPFFTDKIPLRVHNTICGQISKRMPRIREFAGSHDVIIFVSGRQSSNGKVLFSHCKEINQSSWFVSLPEEIRGEWFTGAASAGICGGTSTPRWLMEEVADKIKELVS
jgi:4-hydroxy-3-methylbut-2-en-1-yl diphosphate reductase